MEFSRPEYWIGYPFPSPGDLPNPGIKPRFPELQADSLPAESQSDRDQRKKRISKWNEQSLSGEPRIWAEFFCIEIYLIYNVVLVSGRQQSDSVIKIHIFILFSHIGYLRTLSPLCYTIGSCWLSILYIIVCVYVNPKLLIYPSPPCFPFSNHKLFWYL